MIDLSLGHRYYGHPYLDQALELNYQSPQFDDLYAYWPLYVAGPTGSGNLRDWLGRWDGNIQSSSSFVETYLGMAIDTSGGTGEGVLFGGSTDIMRNVKAASFSCWAEWDSAAGILLDVRTGTTGSSRFEIAWDTGNDWLYLGGRAGDGEGWQSRNGPAGYTSIGEWYHIIGAINYELDQIEIYVDGVPITNAGTPSFTATSTSNTSPLEVSLCRDSGSDAGQLNGRMLDMRVYHKFIDAGLAWEMYQHPHDLIKPQSFMVVVSTPPQTISPSGIASLEAFGTDQLNQNIPAAGIASVEAFGTALMTLSVTPPGIASLEAFGTAQLNQAIVAAGVAGAEAFGATQLNLTVLPPAIASLEAIGSHTIAPGPVTVSPGGIASGEVFGTTLMMLSVTPSGVASLEAVGTAQLNQAIVAIGIASAEAFGAALITLFITPSGIATAEAFGTVVVSAGTLTISPSSIASLETFGTAQLNQVIVATGIASAETFGTALIVLHIAPSGIATAEAFGTALITLFVAPSGIASLEAFGTAVVALAAQTVSPGSIASLEVFGTPSLVLFVTPAGVVSGEAVGAHTVTLLLTIISPVGIASSEAFGTAIVSLFAAVFVGTTIAGSHGVGTIISPGQGTEIKGS